MEIKTKKRKSAGKRPIITREMLLPMSAAAARDVSLKNHLAYVAMREGRGSMELAGHLLKNVYVSYFASDALDSKASFEPFVAAELAIKASIAHGKVTHEWRLEHRFCGYIEDILKIYDVQLASLALRRFDEARSRLSRATESGQLLDLAKIYAATPSNNADG
jgi:hypothetical protein